MKNLATTLLATLLCGAFASANAHQIWIEQDGKTAAVYFGEFGDNLREASPGLLDKFVAPTATLIGAGADRKLKLDKTAGAFVLSARAAEGQSIVAEEASYPAIEKKTGDTVVRSIWTPAARLVNGSAAQQARLTLDIIPTGKAGQFQLSYQGKPLAKTKVAAVAQSGWAKEAKSDEEGMVNFSMPWKGTYVLEAHHTDKTAGQRDGKPYDVATYVTTMSMVQTVGATAIAAPPAAKPNVITP
ncbi:cobalt ABC transporter substrate-binding protein [Massilia violaceinigra]|uniref:Cobalt ABC transporter substrate-binding protein n=1 Tax=Massilia violaceinigra TaxID=2045208 RepID=A0A2D2DQ45_9BURK|nr:DUF4198 domain-containing protein [Massilia violaceinigra]ATQ77102.1 cobalt ABC transporter substrate-binding protein [Massilia violaceinigra]